MGFVEPENAGEERPKLVKAITAPPGVPLHPPPYQETAGISRVQDKPKTERQLSAGCGNQATSSRTSTGTNLVQILTSNRQDLLYNHLFTTASVTTYYDPDRNITSDRVDVAWNRERFQCPWC